MRRLDGDRVSFDVRDYFGSIDQKRLRRQLDRLDPTVWPEITPWLDETGLPQGVSFTPALSNLYLHEIDHRYPQAVRYVDNFVIVDPDAERISIRLRRHLADIGLDSHEIVFSPDVFCNYPIDEPSVS